MSITVSTDVFCDECSAWIHGVTGRRANNIDARRVARAAGWKCNVRERADLCPECVQP